MGERLLAIARKETRQLLRDPVYLGLAFAVPLLLLILLAVMEWDQVLALFDQATPDFELRLKEKPWSGNWLRATAVAAVALNVLPLAEESWRCLQERDDRARW